MTKWEYFAFTTDPNDPADAHAKLNRLGDEGWEAVTATPGTNSHAAFFFLKRPKAEKMQKQETNEHE